MNGGNTELETLYRSDDGPSSCLRHCSNCASGSELFLERKLARKGYVCISSNRVAW